MSKKITLSPTELFFLGKYMQAKYIDYAYVALMPDVQKRFDLCEEQALEKLEEKEIVEEDFSGNVEIDEEAVDLFEPVFFGETESSISGKNIVRVHIFNDRITMSEIKDRKITWWKGSDAELSALLNGNVHIRCSKVGRGFSEKTYTKEQLLHKDKKQKAIQFIKGEI